MRQILYLCCLVLACAGCSSASHSLHVTHVSGLCGSDLIWHDRAYYAVPVEGLPASGEPLGVGGVPSCTDVLGGETGASRAVEVSALAGIEPKLAVGVVDEPRRGYVAAGYFVQLPTHPLHFVLAERTPECGGSHRLRLVGYVERNDGSLTLQAASGDTVVLLVGSRTRILGLSRGGLPYVGLGRKIQVEAVRCAGHRLLALRVIPVR